MEKQPNKYVICEGSPVNGRLGVAIFWEVKTPKGFRRIPATFDTRDQAIEAVDSFATAEDYNDHIICPAILNGENIEVWEEIEHRGEINVFPVYSGSIYEVKK